MNETQWNINIRNGMTAYKVQFELPVNNPENNVRRSRNKQCVTFYLPINYPLIHTLTYDDLVAAAELSGLLHLSTPLNTNLVQNNEIIVKGRGKAKVV